MIFEVVVVVILKLGFIAYFIFSVSFTIIHCINISFFEASICYYLFYSDY